MLSNNGCVERTVSCARGAQGRSDALPGRCCRVLSPLARYLQPSRESAQVKGMEEREGEAAYDILSLDRESVGVVNAS